MNQLQPGPNAQRGTILIATLAVIIAVAGFSLVLLERSENNSIRYRQDRREVQADYVAEAAMSMMIAKMNNDWLTSGGYSNIGSMTKDSSDDPFIIHSGDSEHAPLDVKGADLNGHPKHDRIDNDRDGKLADAPSENELVDASEDDVDADGHYTGGIYRAQVREWVTKSSGKGRIGAENIDDDGDGTVDEPREVNGYTTEDSRKFTIKVVASYGNYTVEMRVFTNATKTSGNKFGLYSEGDLTLKSNAFVDSYDSSIGPYGGANVSEDGNLAAEGDLTIKKNGEVYGDGKYDGSLDNKGTVYGKTKTPMETQDNKLWTLHRDFVYPSDTNNVSQGTTETISENYKQVTVEQNATAVIPEGAQRTFGEHGSGNPAIYSKGDGATVEIGKSSEIYIEESWLDGADTNIVINGPETSSSDPPTKIYIADTFETNNSTDITIDGQVEMYVMDEFDIGSKSEVNVVSDNTTDYSVLVGGKWLNSSGDKTLTSSKGSEYRIKPKSEWMGIVHAPYVDSAELYPKGDFFGSLTANNIDMKSKFTFHYDERISNACDLAAVTCGWVADNTNSWIVAQRGGGPVID